MIQSRRQPLITCSLALGFVTLVVSGFVVAKFTICNVQISRHGTVDSTIPPDSHDSSPVEENFSLLDIERQAQNISRIDRRVALYNILVNAEVTTLGDYLLQSKELANQTFARELQDLVIQRWATIDPADAMRIVLDEFSDNRQRVLLPKIFHEWSYTDLAEALTHARHFNLPLKDDIVDSIVVSREDLTKRQRREIARQLGIEWRAVEIMRHEVRGLVFENPEQEWLEFVHEHQHALSERSQEHLRMLDYVALDWVVQHGVDGMERLQQRLPPSVSLLRITEFIAPELFKTHPIRALELVIYVAEQDYDQQYQDIALKLIDKWARLDFVEAIDYTLTIDARSFRWELQKRALEVAALEDVDALLENIGSLPIALRARAQSAALIEIAKHTPEHAAELLSEISETIDRKRVVEAIAIEWAKRDLSGAIQWIESVTRLPKNRHELTESVFRDIVEFDWYTAFQYALSLPLNSKQEGWEGIVVQWLSNWDPDSAESLLVDVRPGPGRIKAFGGLIANAIYDGDYHRGLEIFLKLCELEYYADQSHFLLPMTYTAPDLVFASIDEIASPRAKIEVARKLKWKYADSDVFTGDEMKRIKKLASEQKPR